MTRNHVSRVAGGPCALALVLAVGIAGAARAGGPLVYDFEPRYVGKLADYGFLTDFDGVKGKLGSMARGCPVRKRGVTLKAVQDDAGGFFQAFPDGAVGPPLHADTCLDVGKLETPGAFAGFELDSPYVPPGTLPPGFVFTGAARQGDGSLTLFTATPGGTLPGTLSLPGDTPAVRFALVWDGSTVDVLAGACDAPSLQPLAEDAPLVFVGTATFGAGLSGADKGDSASFFFAVSGDLFGDAKQDALEDLRAVIDLETAALADLGAGATAAARDKLEEARKRLEEMGPQVPGSDPPVFEPDLLEKVGALPESDARADVLKRLAKAAGRDAKARDRIDRGRPADLKEAVKQASKALEDKVRAKAVLETGVVAEGNGKL